jgi:hypothetical protein
MAEPVSLEGMTQERWDSLTRAQREASRDLSGLTPQLLGLEGWRVEVEDEYGDVRRFIVSRSTGWRPCHIELKTMRSSGGFAASSSYRRVTKIRKVR